MKIIREQKPKTEVSNIPLPEESNLYLKKKT